jgi:hypothetical protein
MTTALRHLRIALLVPVAALVFGCSTSVPNSAAVPSLSALPTLTAPDDVNLETSARLLQDAIDAAQIYADFELQLSESPIFSPCEWRYLQDPTLLNSGTIEYEFQITCDPTGKWLNVTVRLSCTYELSEKYVFSSGSRYYLSESWAGSLRPQQLQLVNGRLLDSQPCPASE